jgi:protease I
MARVAVIIDRHFEDRDLRTLLDGLRDEGHELIPVGVHANWTAEGRHRAVRITIERAARDLDPDALDGLVIPSGYTSSQLLLHHEVLMILARDVYARGKPVGAISTAGWIAFGPDRTHGAHLDSWPSVKRDLLNANASWREDDLLEHRNVRYSRRRDDVEAFVESFGEALAGAPKGPAEAWRPEEELSPIERVYGPEPSEPSPQRFPHL